MRVCAFLHLASHTSDMSHSPNQCSVLSLAPVIFPVLHSLVDDVTEQDITVFVLFLFCFLLVQSACAA